VGLAALLRSIFVVASAASQYYSAEIDEGQPLLYAFASIGSRAAVIPLDGAECEGTPKVSALLQLRSFA
jgi:hypothetical protein